MSAPNGTQLWVTKLSPNGRWIHFTFLRLADSKLEVNVAPAGGAPRAAWVRTAPDHDWPDKPQWAPDGRALFFVSTGSTSHLNLWATRFDPERGQPLGEPFVLTRFDSPKLAISPYLDMSEMSVSPHHAALTMLTVTGSIWMLENVDR